MELTNGAVQTASDANDVATEAPPSRLSKRRKTSHLKLVPETQELRDDLRARCDKDAEGLDRSRPLTKDEM